VADGGPHPGQNELRNFLKEKLPDYMVPSVFVFLKALPLTPNGKVDRATLPAPAESRTEFKGVFVAPRTPVERRIAGIWTDVLRVSEVGAYDNFFELGGHSLLATQVVSRMRAAFQMEITLRSLFESPTVSDLAARIEVMNAKKTAALLTKLEGLSDEEAQRLLDLEGVS
jgi:acyl carrier protein